MANKKVRPEEKFEKLMRIQDLSEFRDFVSEEDNKNRIMRIPITAIFEGPKVFGPDLYFVGGPKNGDEKINLDLNDTRLGIGIKSHLMNDCQGNHCAFWADVMWQGMDGKLSLENEAGLYEIMALGFKSNSEDLDRTFVYSRK